MSVVCPPDGPTTFVVFGTFTATYWTSMARQSRHQLLVGGFLFACWIVASFGEHEYPNPTVDYRTCGRSAKSWVCDPDHVITPAAASRVEEIINEISEKAKTTTCQPSLSPQVAVALVERMAPYGFEGGSLSVAKRFAKYLHDTWGVGHESCQNGVVLFLSKLDRHMYISTGREAKKVLNDEKAQQIVERMIPFLKQGQFCSLIRSRINHKGANVILYLADTSYLTGDHDAALKHGLTDIRDVLVHGDIQWSWTDYLGLIILVIIVTFFVVVAITSCVNNAQ